MPEADKTFSGSLVLDLRILVMTSVLNCVKSTNLKENADKCQSVLVIRACEPKSLDADLNIVGVEKTLGKLAPAVNIAIRFEFE